MKIAYVSSSEWGCPAPPNQIQAALWVCAKVIEGMTARGHETTYIGVDGSTVGATRIISMGRAFFDFYPYNDWVKLTVPEKEQSLSNYQMKLQMFLIETLKSLEVDLVHYHTSPPFFMLPFSSQIKVPKVQTMHDPLYPSYLPIFNEYRDITDNYFVSISQAQRENAPNINYIGNVYNGVPVESYEFGDQPENRLIFLGRIKQIKGVKDAVDVATLTQTPLLIAGRTAMTEKAFIETEITPNVDGQLISQIGVIGHPEKVDYLKKSKALLFPVHWDEPFGLVMIEAMACGTPVIAYNRGSVAEVIKDGVTGFIVNEKDTDQTDNNNTDKTDKKEWIIKKTGIEGLAEAISRIGEIDRKACRKHVEENFSIGKMIDGYEEVYRKILDGRR